MSDQEREAPKRVYQCPGCCSISTMPLLSGGYECDCGEALSLIDLREALAAREEPRGTLMSEQEAQKAVIGDRISQRDRDTWEAGRIYERLAREDTERPTIEDELREIDCDV